MRLSVVLLLCALVSSCRDTTPEHYAVYVLIDRSGFYGQEFDKVISVTKLLLSRMEEGDALALTRIDNELFSEKNVLAAIVFSSRPSQANAQKRAVLQVVEQLASDTRVGSYTDVTGGMLQATSWLNATGATNKMIVVFSTFPDEPRQGYMNEFPVDFNGAQVVVWNIPQSAANGGDVLIETHSFIERANAWQQRVSAGGGNWRLINDVAELKPLLH